MKVLCSVLMLFPIQTDIVIIIQEDDIPIQFSFRNLRFNKYFLMEFFLVA